MSDGNLVDLGKGKIKSNMTKSFHEEIFKDFVPGALIVTEDASMCATIISVIEVYGNTDFAFGNFYAILASGIVSAIFVSYHYSSMNLVLDFKGASKIKKVLSP
jgi:hypothetical protein